MAKAKTKSKMTASSKEPKEELKAKLKSTSPLAGFYEFWDRLNQIDATDLNGLFSILRKLSEVSRDEYFYSSIPVPAHAESELRKLLAEPVSTREDGELEMRRKILRQFKFYLRNQHDNSETVNSEAHSQWSTAANLLVSEVPKQSQSKMFRTTYPDATINEIFAAANKACSLTWMDYRQKMGKKPAPVVDKTQQSIDKATARFENRPDLLEHFKASVAMSPIALSFYAIGLGVDCNQKKSYFNMAGLPKPLIISKNATLVWTVIRALVSRSNTDKHGFVELFKGWYGPFASNDPNSGKAILRRFICPLNPKKSDYYTNNCQYHLVSAKEG